ncbi:hypothetical protein Trydic_g14317, partial [Trypoxylus dichotomus]
NIFCPIEALISVKKLSGFVIGMQLMSVAFVLFFLLRYILTIKACHTKSAGEKVTDQRNAIIIAVAYELEINEQLTAIGVSGGEEKKAF